MRNNGMRNDGFQSAAYHEGIHIGDRNVRKSLIIVIVVDLRDLHQDEYRRNIVGT